jgi:hypothetical protein
MDVQEYFCLGDADALQTTHNRSVYHGHFFEILRRLESLWIPQDIEEVREAGFCKMDQGLNLLLHDRYDKITENDLKDRYMQENVEVAYPFEQATRSRLNDMIAQIVGQYATCITQGDVSQAQKQLRLYQREQVCCPRACLFYTGFALTSYIVLSI